MATRPASRAGKPWAAMIAALGLLCALTGCGEEPAGRAVAPPAEMVDGYAYTAMLMSRHPLWGALRDLEAALSDLDDGEWDPVLTPIDDRFEDIAFLESYALSDPEPRMAILRRDWRSDYPPLLLPTEGLGEDLAARIEWEREQADRAVERRLAEARSAQSRQLAQLRARLVEKYQERLTNLSIEATIRDDEAARSAARKKREQVLQVIEAEIEATREACEQQIAELEAELRSRADQRVEQVRDRAGVVSGEREATMRAAGADLYDEMIEQMRQPWPQPDATSTSAEAEIEGAAANARLDEIGATRQAAEAARSVKVAQQREDLRAALGRLRASIRAGTETAAEVVAYRNGIRLETLPGGRRQGRDVTDVIADELEKFWTVGGGQRS
ncbi:MAG: hypothetical protein GF393_04200 [Armatimonadia bacterium]|nr:hypothetical protein [Armatimonadia bacterium]